MKNLFKEYLLVVLVLLGAVVNHLAVCGIRGYSAHDYEPVNELATIFTSVKVCKGRRCDSASSS